MEKNQHFYCQSLQFKKKIEDIYPETIQIFRKLHQNPEIGLEEHNTSTFIRQYLQKIEGIDILPPLSTLPTAVIASITPEQTLETILLRCELDALGFKQDSKLEYSAQNGLHHACGHDGHMAIMLSVAKLVASERAFLSKKIVFCFQPGEEGKKGASKLLYAYPSLMEAVKNCYALHFHNAINPGWIKLDPGPVTALSNRFQIEIEGKEAHCLAPQTGIDANYIGCTLVSQLYALTGTLVPPMEGCSLVIMKAMGGSEVAMVSSKFKIIGSLRTFSMQSYSKMKERIINLSENLCKSFGAKATVNFNEINYRPVVNDQSLVKNLRKKLIEQGSFQLSHQQRSFAGEDFCQFSEKKPSCYIAIGSALPGSIDQKTGQSMYPAHSPRHKIDEKVLLYGLKLWILIIFD